ncbi:MAG: GNAT family N-acetyltransferase [Geminicoccaceae bacterium]
MRHDLDRAVWSALTSTHAGIAEGGERARRYPVGVVPFAAARDDEPESLEALGDLVGAEEVAVLLQPDPIRLPAGLETVFEGEGVQMVAARPVEAVEDARIVPLGPADAVDMAALAELTKPGPFTLRALEIGRFWGVREEGQLVAMAGERLALRGYVEVSGVCSHPDHRGRGLARLLSAYVAGQIERRGDRPLLHAFAGNIAAIRLYESLGFELRTGVRMMAVRRRT